MTIFIYSKIRLCGKTFFRLQMTEYNVKSWEAYHKWPVGKHLERGGRYKVILVSIWLHSVQTLKSENSRQDGRGANRVSSEQKSNALSPYQWSRFYDGSTAYFRNVV
jgi:hypothetical protein